MISIRAAPGVSGDLLSANLSVDLIDLHMSSDHLAMHEHDLREAHTAADGVMAEAQAKWVGASAAAMPACLARWQEETGVLLDDIAAQGSQMRSAAFGYALADGAGADAVDGRR